MVEGFVGRNKDFIVDLLEDREPVEASKDNEALLVKLTGIS